MLFRGLINCNSIFLLIFIEGEGLLPENAKGFAVARRQNDGMTDLDPLKDEIVSEQLTRYCDVVKFNLVNGEGFPELCGPIL